MTPEQETELLNRLELLEKNLQIISDRVVENHHFRIRRLETQAGLPHTLPPLHPEKFEYHPQGLIDQPPPVIPLTHQPRPGV